MDDNEQYFGITWMVREIAKRTDFTIGDVKVIFDAIEELIKEKLSERATIHFGGLFTMKVIHVNQTKKWDINNNKMVDSDGFDRVVITPSVTLKPVIKGNSDS